MDEGIFVFFFIFRFFSFRNVSNVLFFHYSLRTALERLLGRILLVGAFFLLFFVCFYFRENVTNVSFSLFFRNGLLELLDFEIGSSWMVSLFFFFFFFFF